MEVGRLVQSSSEWESKKLVMGAWKRRRLMNESMVDGWEWEGESGGYGVC